MHQSIDQAKHSASPPGKAPKSGNGLMLHFRPAEVPERTLRLTLSWALGGMATVLIVLLVATGLLLKALQNGYRGLFVRAQDLFDEMYASLADRGTRKLLNRLAAFERVQRGFNSHCRHRPNAMRYSAYPRLQQDRSGRIVSRRRKRRVW